MSNSLETLKKNGKSFYWAGHLLPKKYLNRCAELYSFCRLLDDIADTKTKSDNLKILNNILELFKKNKYNELEKHKIFVPNYLKNCDLAKSKIIDLIDGLIFDQQQVRIENEKQLILYCYKVAGTVGVLMCIALECRNNYSYKFAVDLGIGMQLTNILRDIKEDAELNRRYLPGQLIKNLSPEQILDISKDDKHDDHLIIENAIKTILNISDLYYKSGNDGLVFLTFKIRVAIAIASNVYREIGIKLKKRNYSWHKKRIFTTSFEKFKISVKAYLNVCLSLKFKYPKHNENLHKHLKEIL
tara:strand:+ start:1546 stop:2445 length:900 start_codon:yes stop_codon:yes gene_type:complete